jgi:hypothetical protein
MSIPRALPTFGFFVLFLGVVGAPRAAAEPPSAPDCSTDTTLCIGGRFQITASWTAPDGRTGSGHAVTLTPDSGYFWFLDSNNVEVAIKALNGCTINEHLWIFSAGLTNLAVTMTVTDPATNTRHTYSNPQGKPFETITDTTTFAGCLGPGGSMAGANTDMSTEGSVDTRIAQPRETAIPGGCVGGATALCLNGHIQVEATWQSPSGGGGVANAVSLTPEAGYFWFFDSSNVELIVKALDACAIGSDQWFFAAGMTNEGVAITVTDTFTNEMKTYGNTRSGIQPGVPFVSVLDTSAFSSCRPGPPVTYDISLSCRSSFGCRMVPESLCHVSPGGDPTVHVGDTVTWRWGAGESHWIQTSDAQEPFGGEGPFTYSRTFTEPGNITYTCLKGFTEWEVVVASITVCHPFLKHEEGTITIVP